MEAYVVLFFLGPFLGIQAGQDTGRRAVNLLVSMWLLFGGRTLPSWKAGWAVLSALGAINVPCPAEFTGADVGSMAVLT